MARLLAEGEALTGGANVVNTILVDFRALDTLGEVVVLAVAALGILALVRMVADATPSRPPPDLAADAPIAAEHRARADARGFGGARHDRQHLLRTATGVLAPVMVVASLWLLVRGHDAVGGGFIGGLAGGAAVVLLLLQPRPRRTSGTAHAPHRRRLSLPASLSPSATASAGLWSASAFLAGAKIPLPLFGDVAASLVFDVGVYLVVVGLVAGDRCATSGRVVGRRRASPTTTRRPPRTRRRRATEGSGHVTAAIIVGVLAAGGTYLVLQRGIVRIALGFVLLGHAATTALLAAGGVGRRATRVRRRAAATPADPLPQAFALTAIVISFGVTAFLLTLAYRGRDTIGHDDVEAADDPDARATDALTADATEREVGS